MNASVSTFFVMPYPYSVFMELHMMVVRLSGATSLRDSKCSNPLAQWMSSSPLIRAGLSEEMDHAPLLAVHKTKVQAIRTDAEALFLAPYLIGCFHLLHKVEKMASLTKNRHSTEKPHLEGNDPVPQVLISNGPWVP